MNTFYLWLNDQQAGPYTIAQLRAMWISGSITSRTLYWQEGFSEWLELGDFLDEPTSTPVDKVTSKLPKCPACSQSVSRDAASCPRCGHVFKYAGGINLKDPVHLVGVLIAILMVIGIVISLAGTFLQ